MITTSFVSLHRSLNLKKQPLAAISMSMPSDRFDIKKLPEYGNSISQAAQEISNHLEYIPI